MNVSIVSFAYQWCFKTSSVPKEFKDDFCSSRIKKKSIYTILFIYFNCFFSSYFSYMVISILQDILSWQQKKEQKSNVF